MPIHDWTRVDVGLFHDFLQDWTVEQARALNAALLPSGFAALVAGDRNDPQPNEVEETIYASRANRIVIRHSRGRVVAVIEIVSPGNKSSRNALRSFVRKAGDLLNQGVHLLVVDLFPPSIERDSQGIHGVIWDEVAGRPFELPEGKRLTAVAYQASPTLTAYVEPLAVGDDLPPLPIFLTEDEYVPAPLEETYRASWAVFPDDFKPLLETPTSP